LFRREKPAVGGTDLIRDGRPCVVEVLDVFPLDQPTCVVLQVHERGAPTHPAQVGVQVPDCAMSLVVPGARLPGRWLPGPDQVTIDFPALQA
jgi:hypothetical protein